MNRSKIKTLLFFTAVFIIFVLDSVFQWSAYLSDIDNLRFIKAMANDHLGISLGIYILVTIAGCVILAVPGIVFAVLAGMLFGTVVGILACLTATTLGAMLAFLVGRFFLKDSIKPWVKKNQWLNRLLFSQNEKTGVIVLMITRMIPLFPYNLQNFAYGITDIRFSTYSVCTFLFMLPGVSFFTIGAAGITAGENRWKYFVTAGILALLVTLGGVAIKKRFLRDSSEAIILFSRVPLAGRTKTRLMPELSGEECVRVHEQLIMRAVTAARGTDRDIFLYCTPFEEKDRLYDIVSEDIPLLPQKEGDLGKKMRQAFLEVFEKGYAKAILVGTDVPDLSSEIMSRAFDSLEKRDVVINPTIDGGYYLVGMKEDHEDLWNVGAYGTTAVFRSTIRQAEKAGLSVEVGEELLDVDTFEDLKAAGLAYKRESDECIHCGMCRKNCLFLDKYRMDLHAFEDRPGLAYSCFLCGRCQEVCPKNIDGAKIALSARERYADKWGGRIPDQCYRGMLWEKSRYKFANYRQGKAGSVLFPGCSFMSFYPKTTKKLEKLFKDHGIGIVYDCCRKPIAELGLVKHAEKELADMAKKMRESGIEEIITICPNCYHFLRERLDIPVVTVYEKMKILGMSTVQVERTLPLYLPCPDREGREMLEEVSAFLPGGFEEAFRKIQCCGLGGSAGCREKELAALMGKCSGKESDVLYTYCASCVANFRRKGFMKVYHILPELLGTSEEPAGGFWPIVNRMKNKL